MATDHNPQGRRGHFHNRGRRGPDRRGPERRQVAPPDNQPSRSERGERVDVEQIMREVRARIAQRSGVELSNQQIQELAARRLEAILDPRGLNPTLLDQLRRGAGERTTAEPAQPAASPFDETSLYDSPNGLLRFLRRLLNPILRLLMNPTPIAHALALQSRFNAEVAAREAERDRRQAEWNALHYQILQRLVTEVSRVSIEAQSQAFRIESLGAKVDFNERRVRTMEGTQVQSRPPRPQNETAPMRELPQAVAADGSPVTPTVPSVPGAEGTPTGDAPRRRRRRRRGRRNSSGVGAPTESAQGAPASPEEMEADSDEGFDDESAPEPGGVVEPPTDSAPPFRASEPLRPGPHVNEPTAPPEPAAAGAPAAHAQVPSAPEEE